MTEAVMGSARTRHTVMAVASITSTFTWPRTKRLSSARRKGGMAVMPTAPSMSGTGTTPVMLPARTAALNPAFTHST